MRGPFRGCPSAQCAGRLGNWKGGWGDPDIEPFLHIHIVCGIGPARQHGPLETNPCPWCRTHLHHGDISGGSLRALSLVVCPCARPPDCQGRASRPSRGRRGSPCNTGLPVVREESQHGLSLQHTTPIKSLIGCRVVPDGHVCIPRSGRWAHLLGSWRMEPSHV